MCVCSHTLNWAINSIQQKVNFDMLTGKIQRNQRISHDITIDFLSINYVDSWCPCLFSGFVSVVQHLFTFMEEFWDLSNPTRSHLGHPLHLHQLRDPNIAQPFHDSISIPPIYGIRIYIFFFLALVEFYGKWRYINIPYMDAMGVEIVVKIIDQDYNSVPAKGFRILWIWLEKQRSTEESQNTQQEIPDLWSSLLTICWEVTWLTVQSTGAIPNMSIFERSIFQPRWITELQIKRVWKGNRFIGVVSAKDSDPLRKRTNTNIWNVRGFDDPIC